jgi:hypothetical protein
MFLVSWNFVLIAIAIGAAAESLAEVQSFVAENWGEELGLARLQWNLKGTVSPPADEC